MADEKPRSKHETEKQRWDRNFADLLQELRVAQTGVQILFAFLLTLPFSSGFPKTSAFQKDTYIVALIAAAFATAMIISPVAFHRALFRQGRKPELVRYAHRMATGGLACMLIAMVSSVLHGKVTATRCPALWDGQTAQRVTQSLYRHCMRELVDVHYPKAACIRVVQDNLSIHTPGALYQAFAPAEARRILRRLETLPEERLYQVLD